jgi:hypothetical protein
VIVIHPLSNSCCLSLTSRARPGGTVFFSTTKNQTVGQADYPSTSTLALPPVLSWSNRAMAAEVTAVASKTAGVVVPETSAVRCLEEQNQKISGGGGGRRGCSLAGRESKRPFIRISKGGEGRVSRTEIDCWTVKREEENVPKYSVPAEHSSGQYFRTESRRVNRNRVSKKSKSQSFQQVVRSFLKDVLRRSGATV